MWFAVNGRNGPRNSLHANRRVRIRIRALHVMFVIPAGTQVIREDFLARCGAIFRHGNTIPSDVTPQLSANRRWLDCREVDALVLPMHLNHALIEFRNSVRPKW